MRRHRLYIPIVALALANVACRTKQETVSEQEVCQTAKSEHMVIRDSLRDTFNLDLEIRLSDVNLRVGSATLTASAGEIKARAGRRHRQVRQIEKSDTTSVVRTAVRTQTKISRPRRRPWWLLAVGLGIAAAVVAVRYARKAKGNE